MPLGTVHTHTGIHLWFSLCCSLRPRKQETQEDQEHEEHEGLFHFNNTKTPVDLLHVFNSKTTISIGNKTRVAPRISKSVPEGAMEQLSDVYRKIFAVGGGPGQRRTVNYDRNAVPQCLRPLMLSTKWTQKSIPRTRNVHHAMIHCRWLYTMAPY